MLLDKIEILFADSPSPKAILDFRPSQTLVDRANELPELSRTNAIDEFSTYAKQRDVLDSVTSHFAQLNYISRNSTVNNTKRRAFLKTAVTGAAMTAVATHAVATDRADPAGVPGYGYRLPKLEVGSTLLFQGDSITDMNWGRNQKDRNHYLGHSYVFLIASRLHTDMPEAKLNFLNRGMSGHTVADLQKRWQTDAIDLKPDVLSVLIGINDVGQSVRSNKDVDPVAYEAGYRDILNRSRAANPNLRIVLIEPFVLPVTRDWRNQDGPYSTGGREAGQ